MAKGKAATIDVFEGQSGEMLRTAFAMCEAGVGKTDRSEPPLTQQALEAAAVSLRESTRSFAAAAKARNNPGV